MAQRKITIFLSKAEIGKAGLICHYMDSEYNNNQQCKRGKKKTR